MPTATTRSRVLIWSPRRDLVAALKRSLRPAGLRGVAAGASIEGALEEARPSAIVVDAAPSGSEALRICEAIRDAGACLRSILLIVAEGDTETLEAALALGMSSFAEEPSTPLALALIARGMLMRIEETRTVSGASGGDAPVLRDSLTGLLSRPTLLETLRAVLERARDREHRTAILYLDIDRFKAVNDALGHAAGDSLLRHVARILEDQVRATDLVTTGEARGAVDAYRIGGDEFTVLLSKLNQAQDAGDVAERIQRAMKGPVLADGYQVSATASIGIAVFPDDAQDAEDLLRCADMAMYAAKAMGRGRSVFYEPSMGELQHRRLEIEEHLRYALERGELEVRYQPRVDLANDVVAGMEALIRWTSPELGVVQPKEFIPVAEERGLIASIGEWVLETACRQLAAWRREGLGGLRVSVNVSSQQFASSDLLRTVTDVLRKTDVEPHALELEVTESLMLAGDERTAMALRDLRGIGVTIALDDFGTGYSSLSSITRHPLDVLKIDRAIAADVEENPAAASIVSAVVTLSRSLGLGVVAEGVDSLGQARVLRGLGCDEIQGFVVSPAIEPSAFADLCRDWPGLEHCKHDGRGSTTSDRNDPQDLPGEVEK